ncbi:FkbM family methyltransferase [Algoriphagus hitonicola]|nr:FkbM family methyltransferase [Algoriphagus hitonicola]
MVPILYHHIFKREIYKFKLNNSKPKIIDCGSNIGMAILYWKKISSEAEIIAFEPSEMNFRALKYNIEMNSINNVTLINAAISSKIGNFFFTDNDAASGSLFLEKDLDRKYIVNTVRLDNYLQEEIDFLKIDIEGEEINILDQVVDNLKNIQNIFIEYHSFLGRPQKLSMFLKSLEDNNFRYYIEGEYSNNAPLFNNHTKLKQDLQVAIWAKKSENE